MKKLFVTAIAVLAGSVPLLAQGLTAQITIDNRNLIDADGVTYQAPITGNTAGATAQLFLVGSGGVFTPLTPVTGFRTGSAAAFLVAQNVDVPGVAPGSSATFLLRAWHGESYETAIYRTESAPFTVANLGGDPGNGAPPILPPKLNGLEPFAITIPEPSITVLAVFAGALLFVGDRKGLKAGIHNQVIPLLYSARGGRLSITQQGRHAGAGDSTGRAEFLPKSRQTDHFCSHCEVLCAGGLLRHGDTGEFGAELFLFLDVNGEAPKENGESDSGNSDRCNDERKHGDLC